MDEFVTFYDINNIRIEFHRSKRLFHYSEFSMYDFKVIFKEISTGLTILEINTNEKRIYQFVVNLYQYNLYSYDQIQNERIWFDPDTNGNNVVFEISSIIPDYPIEEEISRFNVIQYNRYSQTSIIRLSFVINEYQLEDLLSKAWELLVGLENIENLGTSELDDYLDFACHNMDAINVINY